MPEDEKNPVEQALDLFLFAPLGLALTARDELPEVIARGRSQVEGQVAMAKLVGQFAVQAGKKELERRLRATAERPAPSASAPSTSTAPPAASPPPPQGDPVPAAAAPPAPAPVEHEDAPSSGPSADDLAIPGYDALSASQVVQRLAGLSAEERAQVQAYEAAGRGRKTILSKIAQLGG